MNSLDHRIIAVLACALAFVITTAYTAKESQAEDKLALASPHQIETSDVKRGLAEIRVPPQFAVVPSSKNHRMNVLMLEGGSEFSSRRKGKARGP